MRPRFFIGFIGVCLIAIAASAQPALQSLPVRAQLRSAVITPGGETLYAAAYDRDEVWVFNTSTWERRSQIPVGKGPVAVALSADGQALACVNRLDNTVSLIRLSDSTVYATLKTGDGPVGIARLSDGRFAVPNTFSDSISLIDSADAGSASTLHGVPPVPVAVAASENYLAVIGRTVPAVTLFSSDLSGAPADIALEDMPVAITALPGDRFAVATKSSVLLVDGATGRRSNAKPIAARDLAAAGSKIYALTGDSVLELDDALEESAQYSLSNAAAKLAAYGEIVVALTPQERKWNVPAPAVAPAPEKVAVKAAPEPKPEARPESKESPAAKPAPEKKPETVARETQPEAPAAPALTEPAAPSGPTRWHPFRTAPGRAPRLSPPSSSPLEHPSRRTIADALGQPTEFASPEAGFVPPDWTDPARDVAAGKTRFELDTGRTVMEDNVHLRLGNMYFRADEFSYSEQTGDYHAQGNVLVEQESSKFTADDVEYVVPEEAEIPEPSLLAPALNEQERAKQRLSLGHVTAEGVHVVEPTREVAAGSVDLDFAKSTGELHNVRGRAGIYYYNAEKLTIRGPRSFEAENVWVTTCDRENPHYRLRLKRLSMDEHQRLSGSNAWLMFGKMPTPLYLPVWRTGGDGSGAWNVDFTAGRKAELGYYVNTGMRFELTPDIALGPRIFPTEKEGVGLGLDVDYDFMNNPASPLYRTQGEAHGLFTTKDRGYGEWYHRYEYSDELVLRAQVELWRDKDIYKDFYYEQYRHRTSPRDFVNLTYQQPGYIATGTARLNTHRWVYETERLPEATFHMLERPIAPHLYLTFDTADGYLEREQDGPKGFRSANVARLTYDWDPHPAFGVTPFWETSVIGYSEDRDSEDPAAVVSSTLGTTLQTRFHKAYPGAFGFSGFKHLIVPSLTISYRPPSSLADGQVPRFDALDNVTGRARIESKLSNVLYGRDAETNEVWQVARLTLYQGNDVWNETRLTEDYEIELDIRPRAYWGFQLAGERHVSNEELSLDAPFYEQSTFLEWYEGVFGRPWSREAEFQYNISYGDYNRILTQLYYDDTQLNGRITGRLGFAYTQTNNKTFNREILYGLGYKLTENWGLGFEHVFDIEDGDLRSQTYEIRRGLHCWETALRFRQRESGLDINLEFSIKAFPGTRLRI